MFETFTMNEERVLALAGIFQATALAQQLATSGQCDKAALEASLASVFRIDAPSVIAVYAGVGNVRLGLRHLVLQLNESKRDIAIIRMTLTVMRLQRSLSGQTKLMQQLQQGILTAQRQVEHFGLDAPQVLSRLAELYVHHLSTLKPRVMVSGNPQHLQKPAVVEQVRAALLAAIRSAVLWRQLGGRPWQMILYRRQCSMLARGLLTGTMLDRGD